MPPWPPSSRGPCPRLQHSFLRFSNVFQRSEAVSKATLAKNSFAPFTLAIGLMMGGGASGNGKPMRQ